MNHKAIYALYPQVVTVDDGAGAFDAQGNQVQIDMALVNAWQDPDAYKYARASAYPSIQEQLDMLWHSVNNGTDLKDSDWFNQLSSVKQSHPKGQ